MLKNIAIVGFGVIATKGHLPTYQARPDIRITAVVDPTSARREVALDLIPDVCVYESLTDLLNDSSQQVDVVDICSPPVFHAAAVKHCLEANKHVLCEKPLVSNRAELETLDQLIQMRRRLLYPCHNYKFAPSIHYAADLIHSGRIGTPLFGSFHISRTGCARGVPEWQPEWRKNRSVAGGGIMLDHGTHTIYIAQNLLKSSPKRVSAFMSNLKHSKNETEDTALFCLDFGGVLISISLTWVASARRSSFLIHGERGEIHIEGDKIMLMEPNRPTMHHTAHSAFDDHSHTAWFQNLFHDFERYLETQEFRPPSLLEAILAAEVIDQAYQSSAQGGCWLPINQAYLDIDEKE